MVRPISVCVALLSACVFCTVLAPACLGQEVFSVSIDTAPLVGNANGPFYLDFQLTDGSGTGDGNNMATLSSFNFLGGSPSDTATHIGDSIGSLGSTVKLTDLSFFNEVYQAFKPGSTVSFNVSLSTNIDAGPTPDEFDIALLDGSLNNIPTTSVGGSLVTIDLTSANPAIQTFATTSPYQDIGSPVIGAPLPATPEPGSLALLAGVGGAGFFAIRTKRLYRQLHGNG
jgi:hypothetical protein